MNGGRPTEEVSLQVQVENSGFVAIWSDVKAEEETDYLHWLTREHTQERLGVPGFRTVRVFRSLRTDVRRYFIYYELDNPEVLASDGYLARLNAPTPWSQRIMPKLGNFARGGGRVIAQVGFGRGGVVAAIRLEVGGASFDLPQLECVVSMDQIVGARLLETDLTRTTIPTREKSMRTHDRSFSGLLLIEGLHEAAVSAAASRHHAPDEVYAQIFEL